MIMKTRSCLALFLFAAIFLPGRAESAGQVRVARVKASSSFIDSDITLTLNPYGIAPLAALAEFTTRIPCNVFLEVRGEIRVQRNFMDESTEHAVPIVGLYPGRENTIDLALYRHHGTAEHQTLSITTDPLPDFFPTIVIDTAVPSQMEPGFNLSVFSHFTGEVSVTVPFLFDATGQVRAYFNLAQTPGQTIPFEQTANGHFVVGTGSTVYEYDVMGRLCNRLDVPGYSFHHDVREMPDGSLLAVVDKAGTQIVTWMGIVPSIADHMIQIERTSGEVLREWDMRALLDVRRNEEIDTPGDWFHMNGVWYCPEDDSFIISGRNQGLVKVTRDNQLVWILAAHSSWAASGWTASGWDGSGPSPAPYLLTAVDASGAPYPDDIQSGFAAADDFDWPWGQHDPLLTPDGTLFVFDNGLNRMFRDGDPYFSRGVEYAVDEQAMTVRQVWQYGKERGQELYASVISSVQYLPLTSNRLIAPGVLRVPEDPSAKVIEVTYPAGDVVFEATIRFKNLCAVAEFGKYDIVYRTRRIPSLYPAIPAGYTP
jgi:arylsulfate sulfotransferase